LKVSSINRAKGCLYGLAVGDALGAPVEFMSRSEIADEFGVLDEMVGGGMFGWKPGQITDDTEMALCIVRSIQQMNGLDINDVAQEFVNWFEAGPTDIGNLTCDALILVSRGNDPLEAGKEAWEETGCYSAGNGSVMRTAPVAIYSYGLPGETRYEAAANVSTITHADPRCTDGCFLINEVIRLLLEGNEVSYEAISKLSEPLDEVLSEAVREIPELSLDDLKTSGYVIHTVQTALWTLLNYEIYRLPF